MPELRKSRALLRPIRQPFLSRAEARNFESEVLASKEPFLLDFSAVWCSPCKALEPIVEQFAQAHRGRLRVGKLDIDESPATAARLGVRGAPTLVYFRDGQEAARRLGMTNTRGLRELTGL